ncbi:MAG: helix-hairpin-helix domain-containing protein [Saccharofermentanales bacterium]|jgi:competence protein ComEA|nr:helix-hairpin-helix domain-containing protein [Bacillota bacterium]
MRREQKQPKRWLIILILAVLIFSFASIIYPLIRNIVTSMEADETTVLTFASNIERSATTDKFGYFYDQDEYVSSELLPVYIIGEVRVPGVYRVTPGQILNDLIALAGGLTAEAAPEAVNLACELKSNQLYRIPSLTELAENPDLYLEGSDTAERFKAKKVDINSADQSELETLPGVGPATALAIIKYREQHGPFEIIEDIMLIPGIKEARFRSLEDLITVN